jgi:hypothetical protein
MGVNMEHKWPKKITMWQEADTGYMSIPFTWMLPAARAMLEQRDMFASRWIVGGPAVKLLPDYLSGISGAIIGDDMPGVLQRVNPMATRTTVGCPNRCKFCGIGQRLIEGDFRELDDWPDKPIICDNNLLAASRQHFDRVIDRLVKWGWCDFNQGLDAAHLTDYHARRIAEIKKPIVRLALDSDARRDVWTQAYKRLHAAGVAKHNIRTYVLCGFHSTPEADWDRCEYVARFNLKPYPMWFHGLAQLKANIVTPEQIQLGWTDAERRNLMGWYYKHRGHRGPLRGK